MDEPEQPKGERTWSANESVMQKNVFKWCWCCPVPANYICSFIATSWCCNTVVTVWLSLIFCPLLAKIQRDPCFNGFVACSLSPFNLICGLHAITVFMECVHKLLTFPHLLFKKEDQLQCQRRWYVCVWVCVGVLWASRLSQHIFHNKCPSLVSRCHSIQTDEPLPNLLMKKSRKTVNTLDRFRCYLIISAFFSRPSTLSKLLNSINDWSKDHPQQLWIRNEPYYAYHTELCLQRSLNLPIQWIFQYLIKSNSETGGPVLGHVKNGIIMLTAAPLCVAVNAW